MATWPHLLAAAVIQKPFHLAEIVELAERHCSSP